MEIHIVREINILDIIVIICLCLMVLAFLVVVAVACIAMLRNSKQDKPQERK